MTNESKINVKVPVLNRGTAHIPYLLIFACLIFSYCGLPSIYTQLFLYQKYSNNVR